MSNEKQNLTIKQRYQNLNDKRKREVRNLFLAKFEYQYSSFYPKLNADNFKTVEREYLEGIL